MDANLYDELWRVEQTHWWFRARRQIVWSLIRRYLPGAPGRRLRICELGCGTGGNLAALSDEHDVVGVECSPHALKYARQRLGDRVQSGGLPDEINLPSAAYDVVLMTDVLEHIEDDAAAAATALRLVRPGGIVVATVPANQWLYSQWDFHHHHFRRYGGGRFRDLWPGPDAKLVLLSHYNTLLFFPAAIARLGTKLLPRRVELSEIKVPPAPINMLLAQIMGMEANLLGRLPLPLGLSLVAVIRKR